MRGKELIVALGEPVSHWPKVITCNFPRTHDMPRGMSLCPSGYVVIEIAAINQWYLKQLDVNNSFLHGDLNEKVYMIIPQGMQVTKPRQVCKLQRSLYGLKQANRQWYAKLSSFLISHGYKL